MLKAAVVGGPSLVFTRKHVAGQTRIRSHKYEEANIVKRIASPFSLFRRSRRDRRRVQDRVPQKQGHDKPTLPGRHRGISGGQIANATVLLRLLGQVHRSARLRAYPDGYGQYVLRTFVRNSGGSSKARTQTRLCKQQKAMALLGQAEQHRARPVQT